MNTQPDTQQPTEYTAERIAELREEFALPDTFDPNTFPPTKTKGMKASISGTARNGKRFIDEGEYDTAKGYFEFFDDMAHQLNQGYYDAAVIINKLLAEIERLQKLTPVFHGADEKPENQEYIYCLIQWDTGRAEFMQGRFRNDLCDKRDRVICGNEVDCYWDQVQVWLRESDLLRAFESHLKQKEQAK